MLLKAFFFFKKNHSKTFTFYKLGGTSSKEPACQFRRHERHGFDPWVRKIPWKKTWQPTLLPGESPWTEEPGGLQSMGSQKSDVTEWLSPELHSTDTEGTLKPTMNLNLGKLWEMVRGGEAWCSCPWRHKEWTRLGTWTATTTTYRNHIRVTYPWQCV